MKKALKIVLIVLLVLAAIVAGILVFLFRGMSGTRDAAINPVDLSAVADGVHHGSYSAGRWSNEVTVEVKDHKIVSVTVDKDVAFPLEEVRAGIIDGVLQKQNVDVDIASGATVTGKAYLKSIEAALTGAK